MSNFHPDFDLLSFVLQLITIMRNGYASCSASFYHVPALARKAVARGFDDDARGRFVGDHFRSVDSHKFFNRILLGQISFIVDTAIARQ